MITNLKEITEPKVLLKPPGPKTRELFQKTGDPLDPFPPVWGFPVIRQEGPWIQDADGNVYLDFVSGKCVANIGHRHPEIVKALKAQVDEVILGCTTRRFELAAKLVQLTPGRFAKKIFFGSSGSDAVDGAIKLARWATQRPNIISVAGALLLPLPHEARIPSLRDAMPEIPRREHVCELLPARGCSRAHHRAYFRRYGVGDPA